MEERGLLEVHQEEGTRQGQDLIQAGRIGVGVGKDLGVSGHGRVGPMQF